MPEETLKKPIRSRSLGISLGVTEIFFLLGLLTLAAGSYLAFSWAGALISTGVCFVVTAWVNALQD
jgi:cytochrome c biogenesis protein CcdA